MIYLSLCLFFELKANRKTFEISSFIVIVIISKEFQLSLNLLKIRDIDVPHRIYVDIYV